MRNIVKRFPSVVWMTLTLILVSPPLCPDQEEVVEQVRVENRELVVRVFDGREPVSGLDAGDFSLYENGRAVPVTSCREVRRTLAPASSGNGAQNRVGTTGRNGRVFLFLLWWNEKSPEWPKAWAYFRDHIFRAGDRVILSDGNHGVQIRSPRREQRKLAAFFESMRENLRRTRLDKQRLVRQLESSARNFHESLFFVKQSSVTGCLNEFKMRYGSALDEYRISRLRTRPVMLKKLAEAMRAVEAEKWTFVFLQNERLPLLHKKSRLFTDSPMDAGTKVNLGRFLEESNRKILMTTDMGARIREMQSLFIGAGATFHLFLSDAGKEVMDTEQLRWQSVFSTWSATFKAVSRSTGGLVSDTTRLGTALKKAARRTDVHYILTFRPEKGQGKTPRLRVVVNRPGLESVFARKLKPREILPLKVSTPVLRKGTLRFELSGFIHESSASGSPRGRVLLRLRARTSGLDPLEFEKALKPAGDVAHISMGMHFPAPGKYQLELEALDLISGRNAKVSTPVTVHASR